MLYRTIFTFISNHEITGHLYQAALVSVIVMIEILRVYDRGLFDSSSYDPPKERSKSRIFISLVLVDFYFNFFNYSDAQISKMTLEFDIITFFLFYPTFLNMIKAFLGSLGGRNVNC